MRIKLLRRGVWLLLAAMLGAGVHAQTLARQGWAGSGISVESWWQFAIFYQIDPLAFEDSGGLRGIVARLDSLQSLGVDAIVLSPFPLDAAGARPFDPAYGTEDDLASLLQEASRRRIRVLVDLAFNNTLSGEQTVNAARFWLSRGVAGLRLTDPDPHGLPLTPAQVAGRLADLTRLCAGYPGQRVLLWAVPESASLRRRSSSEPQLMLDDRLLGLNHWLAGDLRELLTARAHPEFPLATTVLESDARGLVPSFDRFSEGAVPGAAARQVAALLLLGREVPELYAGQELGVRATGTANVALADAETDSLRNWYRRLIELRHTHLALRSGSLEVLPVRNPEVVAWLRRPPAGATAESAVVVVCNLSARDSVVSRAGELRGLRFPAGGGQLRSLASSAPGADAGAAVPLDGMVLPAHGVYVGELPVELGLELAPGPARHRSRRSSGRGSARGR